MNISTSTRRGAITASVFTLVAGLAIASAGAAWSGGSGVRPASAKPHGYSLTEMAAAVAPFTMGENDPALYPDTPFQVLYVNDIDFQMVGSGVVATATQSFEVSPGTQFYAPILNSTTIEPVVGTFPSTPEEAPFNFFDPSEYGGTFEIEVDGSTTPIGPEYLAGPMSIDGGEDQIVTLGAFIGPLSPGSHTIVVRGMVDGDAVAEAHGISYIDFEFTYNVEVQPGG